MLLTVTTIHPSMQHQVILTTKPCKNFLNVLLIWHSEMLDDFELGCLDRRF